jgi:Fe-S cluster assembly protein SufD
MTEVLNQTSLDKNYMAAFADRFPVGAASDDPMAAFRAEGMKAFTQQGAPTNKSEEYRYIPLSKGIERHFDFTLAPPTSVPPTLAPYLIEGLEEHRIVFINGRYSAELSTQRAETQEFTLHSLSEMAPDTLQTHLGKYAKSESDPFVAVNAALVNGGIYLEIPAGMAVEKPFMIVYLNDSSETNAHHHSRNLILCGKNSQATIIEKHVAIGNGQDYANVVTEIAIQENAEIHLVRIQDQLADSFHINHTHVHQADHSRSYTTTLTTSGTLVRNNLQITLDGQNCEAQMMGLYLVTDKTLVDNHTVVDHRKPHSYSNELYKGVLDKTAKGVFNGKIFVRPNAQKTNAFQSNKNILLTDTATVHTKPQLEIWADDVKCSHGCTTGQLDTDALFYLQSRGIDQDSARALLLYAYSAEVLGQIKSVPLKAYLEELIGKRLKKTF